ncbi:MAG: molybdopterin molybdotransferase MoeA [Syntrophomonadaceae bacterium]|nr:molybdopterin molybdotransferase MoeA [Syntrophomonadaceae bacterium]
MHDDFKLEEAQELILKNTSVLDIEYLPLLESCGRILAEDLTANEDLPAYRQSAVDGYALSDGLAALHTSFTITGHLALGDYPVLALQKGEAIGVFTGGAIPPGTQAVVPHEKTTINGSMLSILETAKPDNNIKQQGEDFTAGSILLQQGTRLDPGCIALLSAFAFTLVPVYRRPRVAVLGLGKNVVPCHLYPAAGQTRDTNGPLLTALVEQEGGILIASELVGKYDIADLMSLLAKLLTEADLLITTGGTYSEGENESRLLMESLGAKILYWEVTIQPGSHNGAARFDSVLLHSLSGNPAACAVGYQLLVAPSLRAMQGMNPYPLRVQAKCVNGFPKKTGTRRFVRGHASYTSKGWEVEVLPGQKPSMLRSLLNCNALIDLPAANPPLEAGAAVNIILLNNDGIS